MASENVDSSNGPNDYRIELALQSYRLWAIYINLQPNVVSAQRFAFPNPLPNAAIWRSYFDFLSSLLQNGILSAQSGDRPHRLQQVAELRRVETVYEGVLLKETRFPKATETNREIEIWVEEVIKNWEVLSGPDWNDADLGEGGQDAVGRNVIDILYRAATKTFHSTLILRRLFQVHSSLADFDLALKALETYLEIVNRTRARIKRASDAPPGFDDNDTIFRTVSQGIESLCCFGGLKEAEKAKALVSMVEEWLEDVRTDISPTPQVNGDMPHQDKNKRLVKIEPKTTAIVFRALGIGRANWARWTPVNESRDDMQAHALRDLKKAISPSYGETTNIEANFALSLLLAETRDLKGAIEQLKIVLAQRAPITDNNFTTQRRLVPLWHLLALLLSGRQDFDTSGRSCEAAFEQFPSPLILFGKPKSVRNSDEKTENLEDLLLKTSLSQRRGLVDAMDGREKERIIEIRMTQLALSEVLEGPELAVNTSNELLSLFLRLFGHLDIDMEEKKPKKVKELVPPKSSAGTIKSFRGSLFGRKKHARTSLRDQAMSSFTIQENVLERESSTLNDAPKIQVTDSDEKALEQRRLSPERPKPGRRHSDAGHREGRPQHKLHRREGSLNKMIRRRSQSRPASSYISSQRQSFETGREVISRSQSVKSHQRAHTSDAMPSPSQVGIAISPDIPVYAGSPTSDHDETPQAKQPLPPVGHNVNRLKEPPPPGHKDQPPEHDIRLPTIDSYSSSTQPHARFPKAQAQKHALGILVKTWLLVAGLYRRASMFDDAREACEEAARHAMRIEMLVGAQESSAKAFAERKWACGKSSDELWGDVYAERGYLCLAQSLPHDAMEHFEHALLSYPDHPKATVGLANILLDIYDQKIPPERPKPTLDPGVSTQSLLDKAKPSTSGQVPLQNGSALKTNQNPKSVTQASEELRKTPENLNRLAARDRAYGLLSTLTKLGTGWDNSEAWFALARAYEAGGQIEKAKEVLWWCVELEDRRPVRHWWNVGSGGYVL